jgi:CheY-like chemotaxis protein
MGSNEPGSRRQIAVIRADDIRMRLVLAVFIALAGVIAERGAAWPLLWLLVATAAQLLTYTFVRPLQRDRRAALSRRRGVAILACVGLSASVFAAAGVLFWFLGGWGGRLFAVMIMAGGALNVALQAGASARLFWAGCSPFMAVLVALPLISFASAPPTERGVMGMTAFAAALFVAHLVAAGRQSIASSRRVERALRAARAERVRAQTASTAKSDFLAVMSHELRTPLNGVLGMAQAMAGEALSPEQRARLAVLQQSGEALLALVNDVLEVAKSDAGPSGPAAPPVASPPQAVPSAAALRRAGDRLRVLAAEDNPTNRLVLKTLLEQLGVAVHIVGDGEEAIAAWRGAPWDLVLMDIRMPGLDGVAATRAIRAEEAATGRPRTPILAVTADAAAPQAADYLSVGMDGLIPKPIQLTQLVAVIATVLDPAPAEPASRNVRTAA